MFASNYGRPLREDATPVVLIHGAGMDHTVWAMQGRRLAFRGLGVVAVDLPGHGRSRGAAPLASIEALADAVASLVDGSRPAFLVGHSMGALAALAAAARQPERVAGLCLLGAAARMAVHPELLALARGHDGKAVELLCDWAFGPRGQQGPSASPGGWLQGGARALLRRGDPETLAVDLAACDAYASGPAHAAAVRCPTLVIVGASDRMTPPQAGRELAGMIPTATVAVVDGAGHMMMAEAPEATLAAVDGFLR